MRSAITNIASLPVVVLGNAIINSYTQVGSSNLVLAGPLHVHGRSQVICKQHCLLSCFRFHYIYRTATARNMRLEAKHQQSVDMQNHMFVGPL